MKKFKYPIAILALAGLWQTAAAQTSSTDNQIVITGTRFTYPLVEKWIWEFKQEHPEIAIRIASKGSKAADSANFFINAHTLSVDEKKTRETVSISRYALLPVTNSKNKLVEVYGNKGIKSKDIKKLFFEVYDPAEPDAEQKILKELKGFKPVVYTRAQQACAPVTFAHYYGFEQENIVGKQLGGDDKHLILAVLNDSAGVTYNVPNYIYDLSTRKVKEGISIIPLDLNNNGRLDDNERIYQTIDDFIASLESSYTHNLPFENVTASYKKDGSATSKSIETFLNWVRSKGQSYSHQFGFAVLNEKDLISSSGTNQQKSIAKQK